ncbi:MAG: ethylbenzene dehydrogenase-related protein, partial [Candidatus Poribacteria bacterium]|nr:ethylbenzene dehydrogenase-related protein [Candidatus Poribacteria bacterium]
YPTNDEAYLDAVRHATRDAIPKASDTNTTYLTGRGARNPVSTGVRPSPIEDQSAAGFGTLTTQSSDSQHVRGSGVWQDGSWVVVFVRTMTTNDPLDVHFEPGATIPIAFAVWDGSGGDRNGQKSVTTWDELILQTLKR